MIIIKNNKGFTLIEMIAAIAVLAIVSTVTIISVTNSFQKSKEKSEETFKKQLEGYIYDYISMYGSKLKFDNGNKYDKCYSDETPCPDITLKKAIRDTDNVENLDMNIKFISDMFANKNIVNPNTKKECNEKNTILTIYRDSDFVYCFTIKPNNDTEESCITENISTCEEMYKPASGSSCPNGKSVDENGNETEYCTFK